MHKIELGKPYPGPVPQQDGATIEIGPGGDLVLLIQLRDPSPAEATALKAGFSSYAIYQAPHGLACWVFKFPAPLSYLDAPIHAGLYSDDRCGKLIKTDWNMLQVYVLDGDIVTLIRVSGLDPAAAKYFSDIVADQQQRGVDKITYNASVNRLFSIKPSEIFERGKKWKHFHDSVQ